MEGRPRSFDEPDEIVEFGGVITHLVSIGGLSITRTVHPPGWRWSTHFKPLIGGEWCQAHHVGAALSGRFMVELADGISYELGAGDLFDIQPGHDAWTIGSDDYVSLAWSGQRAWIEFAQRSTLATILFTDIVGSTETASRLGDAAWHDLLSVHFHACRDTIVGFGGRLVETTGDGVLAVFESPARAVRCGRALHDVAARQGIEIRVGAHAGEIELADDKVHGVAVHAAARVVAKAEAGEFWVSETVAALCRGSEITFEDMGEYELKGVPIPLRLYRVTA